MPSEDGTFEAGSFEITGRWKSEKVEGLTSGIWGIHAGPAPNGELIAWTITHIPTGRALPRCFWRLESAKAVGDALIEIADPCWEGLTLPLGPAQHRRTELSWAKALVKAFGPSGEEPW